MTWEDGPVGAGVTGPVIGPANNVLIDHVGGWTLAELDALDLYEKSYVQIDDGCLLVPPGSSGPHQKVASQLTRGLDDASGGSGVLAGGSGARDRRGGVPVA
jgi:hypothetical protein